MTSWTLSPALAQLRAEVDAAHPGRSRISDGTIGDTAHQARPSDHNPNAQGIVRAWDVTADPARGVAAAVVAFLEHTRDPRVRYVIWNRRIMSGPASDYPWIWRPYFGANPHEKHAHISVRSDDPRPWGYPLEPDHQEEPDVALTPEQDRMLREVHAQLTTSRDDKSPQGATVRWLAATARSRAGRALARLSTTGRG